MASRRLFDKSLTTLKKLLYVRHRSRVEGFPREKVLLYALRRELSERKPDELHCPVIRRLIIETFRQIKLDY